MGLDYEIFKLGNVRLQRGGTLPDCKLAYKTFGKISAAKDNVILYPTWYSGQHYDNEWLIGSGMALDPEKYFIIIPNMLGNGLSSSPAHARALQRAALSARDHVRQCAGAVSASDREIRREETIACHRLVDLSITHNFGSDSGSQRDVGQAR